MSRILPIVFAQSALVLKFGVVPLAQNLVDSHGNGVGEIETACLPSHRQTDAAFRIGKKQRFGQTCGFLAKDKICQTDTLPNAGKRVDRTRKRFTIGSVFKNFEKYFSLCTLL